MDSPGLSVHCRPFPSHPETDANGGIADWCPPGAVLLQFRMHQSSGSANDRFAASCRTLVHYLGIGLEIAPSLGYCTGMHDGDDEWLFGIGCPRCPRRSCGPRPIRKRADRWRRFLADRIASIGCTVWGMLPALVSAAPVAVFHAARLAGVSINTMKSVPDSHAVPSGGR